MSSQDCSVPPSNVPRKRTGRPRGHDRHKPTYRRILANPETYTVRTEIGSGYSDLGGSVSQYLGEDAESDKSSHSPPLATPNPPPADGVETSLDPVREARDTTTTSRRLSSVAGGSVSPRRNASGPPINLVSPLDQYPRVGRFNTEAPSTMHNADAVSGRESDAQFRFQRQELYHPTDSINTMPFGVASNRPLPSSPGAFGTAQAQSAVRAFGSSAQLGATRPPTGLAWGLSLDVHINVSLLNLGDLQFYLVQGVKSKELSKFRPTALMSIALVHWLCLDPVELPPERSWSLLSPSLGRIELTHYVETAVEEGMQAPWIEFHVFNDSRPFVIFEWSESDRYVWPALTRPGHDSPSAFSQNHAWFQFQPHVSLNQRRLHEGDGGT